MNSQSNSPRILLAIDHFHPYVGGNETLYWNAARAFVREGIAVDVVTRRDPGMSAEETLEGVHIVRVWTPEFAQRIWFMLLALPVIWRWSREASLIHAVVYGAAFPAWMVAMLRRKPFFLTVHEVFADEWRRLLDVNYLGGLSVRVLEAILLRLPRTRFVCPSNFTARKVRECGGAPANRVFTAYNPVEYDFWSPDLHSPAPLREELGLPADTFVYLYFGRPGASKGVEYLVRAAAIVHREIPAAKLVMYLGRKPADRYAAIERLVREGDLWKTVLLRDSVPRSELPGKLLAADCVVVPSLSEGFGYSAVEAATLGCLVIATSGHAVEEVLQDEIELVPPRDAEALARKIIELAQEPRKGKPAAKQYDLARHLAAMRTIYGDLVQTAK